MKNLRLVISIILLLFASILAIKADPFLLPGSHRFSYPCSGFFKGTTLDVFFYVPQGVEIQDMKVQFVMHGTNRNASRYRDAWISLADQYHLIIIAPQFDKGRFPSEKYQQGNVKVAWDQYNEEALIYGIIDDLFCALNQKYHFKDTKYNIFGHSAGAQFVHRFVLFYSSPYLDKAVAANAGTYTLLTNKANYPFGYRDIGGVSQISKDIFSKQLIVLLGDGDTIRDANLNISSAADKQGLNRWQRGHNFFISAQQYATKRKCSFNWQLDTVPNVAHSASQMSIHAADLLYK